MKSLYVRYGESKLRDLENLNAVLDIEIARMEAIGDGRK